MAGVPEAEACSVLMMKVVLPNGDIKSNVLLNSENLVREEKETILRDAQIPYPVLYVMVVYGPQGSYTVLDDSRFVESYIDALGGGDEFEIHIRKRSSQVERPARAINPELFNINMK